ncbi:hypothetical protein [Burkholderia sp. USMB20]|uniref:hypothetical protein n=1 Tax=Burkholderia sp. USMB20 TaxID=1571773 RepID=UPI0005CE55C7|nr:hypothetical protein [Burkholderia sp. USMB20]TGN96105.1 hypothetical protein PL79_018840 [Burkholderia sp. USMB20]
MDAGDLKFGDKVWYAGVAAVVQRIAKNGAYVSFDGRGLRAGEHIIRRVSALDLSHRGEHVNAA